MKSYSVTIQIDLNEQCIPLVLFIILMHSGSMFKSINPKEMLYQLNWWNTGLLCRALWVQTPAWPRLVRWYWLCTYQMIATLGSDVKPLALVLTTLFKYQIILDEHECSSTWGHQLLFLKIPQHSSQWVGDIVQSWCLWSGFINNKGVTVYSTLKIVNCIWSLESPLHSVVKCQWVPGNGAIQNVHYSFITFHLSITT